MAKGGKNIADSTNTKKVEIYSTPTCVYCNSVKQLFAQHGISYTEYNVATDLSKRQEMVEKSGQLGVPVTSIDGEITIGFDEPRLTKLLGV
jgi:glutaredoxin-like YruB-family protein